MRNAFGIALFVVLVAPASIDAQSREPYQPTAQEIKAIESRKAELDQSIEALRNELTPDHELADVEIFSKATEWILRYRDSEFYRQHYVQDSLDTLAIGQARARALERGERPWIRRTGRVVRAYRSRVDGSLQPYSVVVPKNYPGDRRWPADVILHGRNSRLNEVSFLRGPRDEPDPESDAEVLRLEVYGRTNNAYRWAGETDVFEALAAFEREYRVDRRNVVLRGFSMGGAGAWHLGLHHPTRWKAVEAGAGFTDTLTYAKNSLTEADTRPWQRAALHIYDAVDYARNVLMTNFVGYGGEDDPQLQASVNIREALEKGPDGLRFRGGPLESSASHTLLLVGPGTKHRWHPGSRARSERQIRSVGHINPDSIQFTTHTTAFGDAGLVTIDGLDSHYEHATVTGSKHQLATSNVSRLILRSLSVSGPIVIDEQDLGPAPASTVWLSKDDDAWRIHDSLSSFRGESLQKRPGLQGPIDDAFRESFVLAMPTAKSAPGSAHEAAVNIAEDFRRTWAKYLRGDTIAVDDTAITPAVARDSHVVVFGDPSSNRYLASVVGKLPVTWNSKEIRVGSQAFPARNHLLRMIYPNPNNPSRYLVINSGHTFGEKEFKGTNALLYPRLGDWAVIKLDGKTQSVAAAGFFDEAWQPK